MTQLNYSTAALSKESDADLIVRIITGENQRNKEREHPTRKIQRLNLVIQNTGCDITKKRATTAVELLSTLKAQTPMSKNKTNEIIKKLDTITPVKKWFCRN